MKIKQAIHHTATPDEIHKLVAKHKVTAAQLDAVMDQIKNPPPLVKTHVHEWGSRHIRFGVCSDIHVGSKYADYGALNDLFKRFNAEGIERVYIPGDITEGYDRRKGQAYECDLHGFDAQVEGAAERIPQLKKGKIYFITGDHDGFHKDNAGVHVGPHLQALRPDMEFLGECQSTIEFSKECRLMMSHPAKGTSYAISYQVQKMIEAFAGGTKPHILLVGHYHKAEYIFYRNVHAVQSACIQRQSGWMKRMGLAAHMGGWIIDVWLNKERKIDRIRQELIPYYE